MQTNGLDIELIVSDIDGTILTSENALLPSTEEIVREVINDPQCNFTFSTGRAFPMVQPMVEFFKLKIPFIYSSGAIYDPIKKEVISAHPIGMQKIEKVEKIAEKFKVGMIFHTESGMYCRVNDADWETINSLEWIKGKKEDHAYRIQNYKTEIPEAVIRLDIFADVDWLDGIWQEVVDTIADVYPVKMKRSIEISQNGIHKGSALMRMSQILDIPLEKIMTVGDSANDVPLLLAAGYSVAMETAPEELKEVADMVVPSANENGLAEVLQLICKNTM